MLVSLSVSLHAIAEDNLEDVGVQIGSSQMLVVLIVATDTGLTVRVAVEVD